MRLLKLWFGLSEPVTRRIYLLHGAALVALKYAIDAIAAELIIGRFWQPLDYFNPVLTARTYALGASRNLTFLIALALWTMPFLWIGVSMTLRRLIDAGLSPWLVLLYFVPLVNWLLSLVPCLKPSAARKLPPEFGMQGDRIRTALLGIAGGVAVGLVSFGLHVLLLKSYSGEIGRAHV